MGYLLRRDANRVWSQPKRKKCVVINKAERIWRSEQYFDIRHGDIKLEVCLVSFWFVLVQYLLMLLHFLLFEMVIYIMCHCTLEVCDLHFLIL